MKEQLYDLTDFIKDCEFFNRCCELYEDGFTEIFDSLAWKNFLK